MNKNIKISVIIPVYNSVEYLDRCLNSLLNQTLKDIEIICINDASKDESLTILNKYKDNHPEVIKVIDLKENKKQGGARNAGLDIASGEYVAFVDSDDWVELHMFEHLYSKARQNDFDIVDCNYTIHNGYTAIEDRNSIISDKDILINSPKDILLNFGGVCTKIYKIKFFDKSRYGLRFPEGMFYEDNYLMPFIAIKVKKIGKVNEALYKYYYNDLSTTKVRNDVRFFDRLISAKKMYKDLQVESNYSSYKEEAEFLYIKLFAINTLLQSLSLFDNYPSEKIGDIKEGLKELNWSGNKYYKQLNFKTRMTFRLLMVFHPLAVLLFKMKRLIRFYL
ncbi:hypothetical protein C9J48_27455 [Photobacterium profundum]|uniref:Glycosyltransferase n=1 Tax=Photobacterium profundum 3TCK TaxID=314280 RepID=Q1Z875_9GAMM|nr:glycosyltransferase [Photobacterium profundum]EAS44638.1 glycosyltransferase [Photobacterium profundum 3TCK]PSV56488.1 hypothetical protein C9J48_27455 [Photobacterium profundum]